MCDMTGLSFIRSVMQRVDCTTTETHEYITLYVHKLVPKIQTQFRIFLQNIATLLNVGYKHMTSHQQGDMMVKLNGNGLCPALDCVQHWTVYLKRWHVYHTQQAA